MNHEKIEEVKRIFDMYYVFMSASRAYQSAIGFIDCLSRFNGFSDEILKPLYEYNSDRFDIDSSSEE